MTQLHWWLVHTGMCWSIRTVVEETYVACAYYKLCVCMLQHTHENCI